MEIRNEILELVFQLEIFSNNALNFKEELSELIEIATSNNTLQELNNATFSGKGVWNIFNLMKRNGPNSQGYDKLVVELTEQIHRTTKNIKPILEKAPAETKRKFYELFFKQSQDSFADFLSLCSDLRYLKNMTIDNKQHS